MSMDNEGTLKLIKIIVDDALDGIPSSEKFQDAIDNIKELMP
jgi:hypothetical protein